MNTDGQFLTLKTAKGAENAKHLNNRLRDLCVLCGENGFPVVEL